MSAILRTLSKLPRSMFFAHNKTFLSNSARTNANVANAIKSRSIKNTKESVEVFKWILLMLPVGSFGLGCWQVYRLQWKLDLIDKLQTKTNASPTDLPTDFEELEELEYMPVKVKGHFLHDKEIIIGPRSLIENDSALSRVGSLVSDPKKNQGWLVITPFKLSDSGKIILINRGWIPQHMKPKERRQASLINKEVELTGVVRLTEKRAPFIPKNNPEKGAWFSRRVMNFIVFPDVGLNVE